MIWLGKLHRRGRRQTNAFQCSVALYKASLMCRGVRRFDGDGMLHAVRIKAGKASYSNAYVQTSLLKQENKAGKPLKLQACPSHTLINRAHFT